MNDWITAGLICLSLGFALGTWAGVTIQGNLLKPLLGDQYEIIRPKVKGEGNSMLIEQYLHSNKYNFEVNEKMAKHIRIGQYVFIFSLVLVPILIAILFSFPPQLNSTSQ